MSRLANFWRNVAVIGSIHAAVVAGFIRFGGSAKKSSQIDIAWLNPSILSQPAPLGDTTADASTPSTANEKTSPAHDDEQDDPVLIGRGGGNIASLAADTAAGPVPVQSNFSDLSRRDSPFRDTTVPKSAPTQRLPARKIKSTVKRTESAPTLPHPKTSKRNLENPPTPDQQGLLSLGSSNAHPATGKTANSASRLETSQVGRGTSTVSTTLPSASDRYAKMLHDRFFSEWIQPKSVAAAGSKMGALVRLEIELNGGVSEFSIIRSSGNIVIDDSVRAVANRVTRVEPPPFTSGQGRYEVNINFELSLE